MAIVTLDQAKKFLDVTHDSDDDKLTELLNGALDEAAQFLGYDKIQDFEDFLASSDNVGGFEDPPPAVATAVKLLIQAKYQTPADEIKIFRDNAESLLMPYRVGLGL